MKEFKPFSETGSISCAMKNVSINSSLELTENEARGRMESFNNELYLLFRKHGIATIAFERHGMIGYFQAEHETTDETGIFFGVSNGEIFHFEEEQPKKGKGLKRIK